MLGENARGSVGVPNTHLAIADLPHLQSGWMLRLSGWMLKFFPVFVEKSVLPKNSVQLLDISTTMI